ncbi:MAG: ATP synthase F0 subunit B [Planctomycetaceae bacterium]|nr:MAG: ATP synthase F0 subunit B [Planctomycetaceae bacterium]
MLRLVIPVRALARAALLALSVGLVLAWLPADAWAQEADSGRKAEAETHSGDGHADDAHGGEHGQPPGPMTATKQDADLALWTLITFGVFLVVLGKMAWKPLTEGLDKREAKIMGALSDAEAARVQSQKMLIEHQQKLDRVQDQVREILAEARRDADITKADIVATAQKESEAMRHRAVTDVERARDQALDELFEHMTRCVDQATQQVIGRSLSGEDHDRLIRESLQQFAHRKN